MGQVAKLANNLVFAAQMLATAEATTMAAQGRASISGPSTRSSRTRPADCTAVRTRIPFEGVLPDSPASNGWKPGFMTDLMAKDLDLAIGYAGRAGVPVFTPAVVRPLLTAAHEAGYGREDLSAVGKVIRRLAGIG